jgi:UDP-N-acetyl-D-glucosamine dehydrogenase
VKIAIIGQGHVGFPLAKAAANAGHHTFGFDVNSQLIAQLGLSEANTPNYTPTTDSKIITGCDIYIIAVPTPLDINNRPDLSYLNSAANLIGKVAKDGALIVNESTSYPGTLREIVEATISNINKAKLLYAAAPERIDPANMQWSIKNTPRVIAGLTDAATEKALEFYKSFCDHVQKVSSPEVAEAAKLFENTFRQVNIALVNEFAQIAEKFGISANEVIDAAATKPFGFMKFTPSLGVGGHCIPIDPIYLEQKAESLGITATFIKQATRVNQNMPLYIVSRLEKILGNNLKDKKICIVGLSYKKDVADLRQSPSIELWKELERRGCVVTFHDEIVKTFNKSYSVALDKSAFDLAVVGIRHTGLDVDKLKVCATYLFDCTGSIAGLPTL